MPLSKKRNAERMRRLRASHKNGGTALLSKALLRKMRTLGIETGRYLAALPVSLDDYRALERTLTAKVARVEWQSGGIKMLQEQVTRDAARLTQLEGDLARLEAMIDSLLAERMEERT